MVAHFISHPTATAALAEKRPLVSVALAPMFESVELPPPGAPALGKLGNWVLWRVAAAVLDSALGDSVNAQRVRYGLPRQRALMRHALDDAALALVCASPSLLARCADWATHVKLTGFLAPKKRGATWTAPADLRGFLDAGEPPLFASFGSMFSLDDTRTKNAGRGDSRCVRARWDARHHSGA